MIFETEAFYVDLVDEQGINDVVEVYNSNKYFLVNHLGTDKVTCEWMLKELEFMRKIGFYSCKVVEKSSGRLMGIIDFQIGEEVYLSLLMLHRDFRSKGFGKSIYQALEEYCKKEGSKRIRIDVVADYDNTVFDFWIRNGFHKFSDIELNWSEKTLPAVVMKKSLQM